MAESKIFFLVNQRFSNQFIFLYFRSSSHLSKLTHSWHFSVSEGLHHHFRNEPLKPVSKARTNKFNFFRQCTYIYTLKPALVTISIKQ
jgi:hypothetical protein